MIRIKVIRASRLLLGITATLLAVALAALLLSYARSAQDMPTGAPYPGEIFATEEEAEAVFASASSSSSDVRRVPVVFGENEHTDDTVRDFLVEVLPLQPVADARILIYHTHTHEAYTQTEVDPYVETEQWRTADPSHSVVRVGAELADALRGYGFTVVHDTTDHEPPRLGTAYARSLATLESYVEPFDCYIDLHRDAYNADDAGARLSIDTPSGRAAQLMCLVGNGEGFDVKPDYAENRAFAQALTERLNTLCPGLCRDVLVKTGRYNQHVGRRAVLIEAGHNRNTLQEALTSMPFLAQALRDALLAVPS